MKVNFCPTCFQLSDNGRVGSPHLDDAALAAQPAPQVPAGHLQRPLAHQVRDCLAKQDDPSTWTGKSTF